MSRVKTWMRTFFFELMPCTLEALTVIKTFCIWSANKNLDENLDRATRMLILAPEQKRRGTFLSVFWRVCWKTDCWWCSKLLSVVMAFSQFDSHSRHVSQAVVIVHWVCTPFDEMVWVWHDGCNASLDSQAGGFLRRVWTDWWSFEWWAEILRLVVSWRRIWTWRFNHIWYSPWNPFCNMIKLQSSGRAWSHGEPRFRMIAQLGWRLTGSKAKERMEKEKENDTKDPIKDPKERAKATKEAWTLVFGLEKLFRRSLWPFCNLATWVSTFVHCASFHSGQPYWTCCFRLWFHQCSDPRFLMCQSSQVYTQWLSVRLITPFLVLCAVSDWGSGRVCSLFDSLDLTELVCCFIHLLALCGLAMLLPLCSFDHFGGHVIGFDTFHRNYIASANFADWRAICWDHFGASRRTCANWLFAGRSDVSGLHLVFRDSKRISLCLSWRFPVDFRFAFFRGA